MSTTSGGRSVRAVVLEALMAQASLEVPPNLGSDMVCDLGISSFDMMVLCVRIEEGLDRPVSFGALVGVRTVGDLVVAVESSLG